MTVNFGRFVICPLGRPHHWPPRAACKGSSATTVATCSCSSCPAPYRCEHLTVWGRNSKRPILLSGVSRCCFCSLVCDSEEIRTLDPQLRRLLLYPAELRNHQWLFGTANILYFSFIPIQFRHCDMRQSCRRARCCSGFRRCGPCGAGTCTGVTVLCLRRW